MKFALGRRSTLRNVGTWNFPLNNGASTFHCNGFGLFGPLSMAPTPRSKDAKPSGLAVYPYWSGLFSHKYGIARFLGTPVLAEVKSVNSGATSAAARPIELMAFPLRWH